MKCDCGERTHKNLTHKKEYGHNIIPPMKKRVVHYAPKHSDYAPCGYDIWVMDNCTWEERVVTCKTCKRCLAKRKEPRDGK